MEVVSSWKSIFKYSAMCGITDMEWKLADKNEIRTEMYD